MQANQACGETTLGGEYESALAAMIPRPGRTVAWIDAQGMAARVRGTIAYRLGW